MKHFLTLGAMKIYQIDLKILSDSTIYKYDYLLDNNFFEGVNGTEVRKGKVNVSLSVKRISSVFEMDFRIEGVVAVTCDRCLDNLEISIKTTNRLCVTFGKMYAELSDERIIVSEEEGIIDIAWIMYEFIALAIPMKHVHETSGCNEIMAAKLSEICVDLQTDKDEYEDDESLSDSSRSAVDPRWDTLRRLTESN